MHTAHNTIVIALARAHAASFSDLLDHSLYCSSQKLQTLVCSGRVLHQICKFSLKLAPLDLSSHSATDLATQVFALV
jgi:hypothetical protein